MILFEPPTSEHISARTIFDPITALAPATDCRTYAIGYVGHRDCTEAPMIELIFLIQVSKWINPDRNSSPPIHHPPYPDHFTWTVAHSFVSLACLLVETEIGHVGYPSLQWRSESLERGKATGKRGTASDSVVEAFRLGFHKSQMDGMVKEWADCAVFGRVGIDPFCKTEPN